MVSTGWRGWWWSGRAPIKVSVRLRRSGSSKEARLSRSGARVLVDGKALGDLELRGLLLRAGEHEVLVKLQRKQARRTRISITLSDPDDDRQGKRRLPVGTLVVGGAAVLAGVAGVVLGVASRSAFDEYLVTESPARFEELREEVSTLDTGANISFAVAGALAITAVMLYFLVDRPASRPGKSGVKIGPTGAAVTWEY